MGVCIVQEQASHLRLLGAHQGIICSFLICLFLPSADISNLFELFFTQNYPHTPTLRVPCVDNLHVPGAPIYVPFLPIVDISNLFELFFTRRIVNSSATTCG
jgi:hypothetical protein